MYIQNVQFQQENCEDNNIFFIKQFIATQKKIFKVNINI